MVGENATINRDLVPGGTGNNAASAYARGLVTALDGYLVYRAGETGIQIGIHLDHPIMRPGLLDNRRGGTVALDGGAGSGDIQVAPGWIGRITFAGSVDRQLIGACWEDDPVRRSDSGVINGDDRFAQADARPARAVLQTVDTGGIAVDLIHRGGYGDVRRQSAWGQAGGEEQQDDGDMFHGISSSHGRNR